MACAHLKPFGSADLSVVLHIPARSNVVQAVAGGLGGGRLKFSGSGLTLGVYGVGVGVEGAGLRC